MRHHYRPALLAVLLAAGAGRHAEAGERGDERAAPPSRAPSAWTEDDDDEYEREARPYTTDAVSRTESRLNAHYGAESAFARPKASKINDRVTIVINDSITASSTQKTDFGRKSGADWSLNEFFTIRAENGGLVAVPRGVKAAAEAGQAAKVPRLNFDFSNNHSADGKNNINSTLRTEISGQVQAVLPNGHLVVQAVKSQAINRETQSVIFSGVVDPADLDARSRVQDRDVINREIRIEGKGVFADFNNRGILAKFFSKFKLF